MIAIASLWYDISALLRPGTTGLTVDAVNEIDGRLQTGLRDLQDLTSCNYLLDRENIIAGSLAGWVPEAPPVISLSTSVAMACAD